MTEADFQRTVIDAAQRFRWRVAHFRPAKTDQGWRTAVAADGQGFPDLVLVRDRVLFVELKTDRGKLTAHQRAWRDAIQDASDASWKAQFDTIKRIETDPATNLAAASLILAPMAFQHLVWRPRDWPAIEKALR